MTAGTLLGGRYELVRQLGAGGFGSVWRARDTRMQRDVAVKIIELDADADADTRERATVRFQREAHAVAGLNHPNVVAAYDFDVSGDTAYLVMELIDGKSLAQIVRARYAAGEGPLDVPTVLRIADNVCAGLGAAHRAGLVHRDLKPANLMVLPVDDEPIGQVKIVDFGIARVSDRSKLTRTGSYMGTLPYIAPEQMTSRTLDGRTDIYALGCLMFELMTGRSAYEADTPVQWLAAHQYSEPYALADHLPDAPPTLDALIREMLAKDPAARPQNVGAVRQRIAAIVRDLDAATADTSYTPAVPLAERPAGMSATLVEGIQVPPDAVAAMPAAPISAPPSDPPPLAVLPISGPPVSAPPVSAPPVSGPPGFAPTIGELSGPDEVSTSPVPMSDMSPEQPSFAPGAVVVAPQYPSVPQMPPVEPTPPRSRRTTVLVIVGVVVFALLVYLAFGPLGLFKTYGGTPGSSPPSGSGSPASPGASHPVVARTTPECTLKIAFVGTLNSTFKERDQAEYQGMQLALAQYNATHADCPVTPAMFDTNPADVTDPGATVAAAGAAAAKDGHVIAALGPSSSTDSPAVLGELDKAGVPEISASANNDNLVTRKYTVFHRATANRGIVFNAMANWIAAQPGSKVYAVDDTSQFGKYLTTTLKARLKGTVIASEETLNEGKQTDFSATVGRVLASGANTVAWGGTMTNGGHLLSQLRTAGYTGLFLIHDLAYQPPFASIAGSAAGGVKVFCGCTYSLVDGSAAFNAAYKAKFGTDPVLFANIAYDVTNMMLKGIGEGAVTRKNLNTWLGSHTFVGMVSSYKFAANGELDPSVTHVNVFTVGEPGEQNVPIAQG